MMITTAISKAALTADVTYEELAAGIFRRDDDKLVIISADGETAIIIDRRKE